MEQLSSRHIEPLYGRWQLKDRGITHAEIVHCRVILGAVFRDFVFESMRECSKGDMIEVHSSARQTEEIYVRERCSKRTDILESGLSCQACLESDVLQFTDVTSRTCGND